VPASNDGVASLLVPGVEDTPQKLEASAGALPRPTCPANRPAQGRSSHRCSSVARRLLRPRSVFPCLWAGNTLLGASRRRQRPGCWRGRRPRGPFLV